MAPTTRTQIITYVSPSLRVQLERDRRRLSLKHGRPLTVSAYVENILSKHLARYHAHRRPR